MVVEKINTYYIDQKEKQYAEVNGEMFEIKSIGPAVIDKQKEQWFRVIGKAAGCIKLIARENKTSAVWYLVI